MSQEKPHEEEIKTILSWQAPSRPFKKRDRSYFRSILLIACLVEIILFLFSQYMLMLVVASLVFVSFALATVPPHKYLYRISTQGLMVEEHFFLWQELYDFYFKERHGQPVVHLRTKALIPGEIVIPLEDISPEEVKNALVKFIPFREIVKPTSMEKAGNWLSKTFPLESPPAPNKHKHVAS